jgi:hypothetical protein
MGAGQKVGGIASDRGEGGEEEEMQRTVEVSADRREGT